MTASTTGSAQAAAGTPKPTAEKLDPQFVDAWADRLLRVWNAHDAGAVASMCTEDVVWEDPALSVPARGRQAVHAFVEATARAFPDFHVEGRGPHFVSPTEKRVLSPYVMTGTMLGDWEPSNLAATGARITISGIDEWIFRGDLMCHYRTHYDSLDMARQLGILPPIGSRAERTMTRLQHVQAAVLRRKARRSHGETPRTGASRSLDRAF